MNYYNKKKIGKALHTFTVEGNNLFECLYEASKLSFDDVDNCGCCGSDNLQLGAHIAQKKYKYATIRCLDCHATLNFGSQAENPNIFYLKKDKDKNLEWKEFRFADNNDEAEVLPE